MKILLFLIILISCTYSFADVEGDPFFEIGPAFSFTPGPTPPGENPLLMVRAGFEGKYWRAEWGHQSSIRRGPPYDRNTDDRKEQDHFAMFFRYTFK